MGCRLPKLRKTEERRSPGNIYSTLRRPQVETKVGVAYTYYFLDFLLGKEEVPVSSVLCLSSVRELPVQVRELYAQGFVLVSVHPFVHSCGPRQAHIQRQLHRAVLVRETPSSEKSQMRWARQRLETDVCVAGHQAVDPEMIQSYVKKIQDVAEQGVMFVGFLQQPGGGPCFLGQWEPEELSSLHSSPSPIHRNPFSTNTSPTDVIESQHSDIELEPLPTGPQRHGSPEYNSQHLVPRELDFSPQMGEFSTDKTSPQVILKESLESTHPPENHHVADVDTVHCSSQDTYGGQKCVQQQDHRLQQHKDCTEKQFNYRNHRERHSDGWLSSPELQLNNKKRPSSVCTNGQSRDTTHNNNHICLRSSEKDKSTPAQARMQLFALYNHTEELNTLPRFYSLRVPLRVQKEAGVITDVEAHWLDHMTQHFTSGAHLIDGFFHLEDDKHDNGVSSVDSVFIFQSSAEENASTSYDAIVVEQWTVVDGVVVKTDYIPLLQSLAPFGWRLMCVLPTPIVKTNSDGSLSTKQILFLQRPVLQRKRKDFKMLNLRGRSKAKKNPAEVGREISSPAMETEMDVLGRRIKEEEEEAWESRRNGRMERPRSQSGRKHGNEDVAQGRNSTFLSESRVSVEDQEEETNVDMLPLSKQEKSVTWTDVCQSVDGDIREKMKMEEQIRQQLFSGVC